VHDAKRRLRPGHLPVIFTDAYAGYASAILEAFGRRYPSVVLATYQPGGLDGDTGVLTHAYKSRNPWALS